MKTLKLSCLDEDMDEDDELSNQLIKNLGNAFLNLRSLKLKEIFVGDLNALMRSFEHLETFEVFYATFTGRVPFSWLKTLSTMN
jgi:hypothetical protein